MSLTSIAFGSAAKPFVKKEFLGANSSATVTAQGPEELDVVVALAENSPFPPRQIDLGEVSVQGQGGKPVVLKGLPGQGNVSFTAQAGFGLAVYPDPVALVAYLASTLNWAGRLQEGFTLPDDPGANYLSLTWRYDFGGSGKLSARPAELGGGIGASFGIDAETGGLFALIQRAPKSTGARTAVAKALSSWRLPKRVRKASELAPGTWLLAAVDGSLKMSLDAEYGYNMSWVRQAKLGELVGDIGLKLELGVSAKVGAQFSGRYAVVLGRETSAPVLRLRIYKIKKKGWNFALNAGATVTGDTSNFSPASFETFLAGVLGLNASQVIGDLDGLEKWTDPQRLPKELATLGTDYLFDFIHQVTGVDPVAEFNQAKGELLALIQRWNALPQRVAAQLWKAVGEGNLQELQKLHDLAQQIATSPDDEVRRLIGAKLSSVEFFSTPSGRWLLSVAEGKLLSLVSGPLDKLQAVAGKTTAVIDPGRPLELFTRFQQQLSQRLGIDKIEAAAQAADPAQLDDWLAARLAKFIGAGSVTGKALGELNAGLTALRAKSQEFYGKTLAALNKSYQFSLATTYQSTSAGSALFDVEFDFQGGKAAAASELLADALAGDFNALLTQPSAAVKLNQAVLSHNTERQSHVEISLPWLDKTSDWKNTASAALNVEDDSAGRLLLYTLSAEDSVRQAASRANFARCSSLGLTARLPKRLKAGVSDHRATGENYSSSYSLRRASQKTVRKELEMEIGPYLQAYFAGLLEGVGNGKISDSFDDWLVDLDKALDPVQPGTGNLGFTLFSLEVALSDQQVGVWFQSGFGSSDYQRMSKALQHRLKAKIAFYYFADIGKLGPSSPNQQAVLLYTAIAPHSQLKVVGQQLEEKGSQVYWDYLDSNLLRTVLSSGETQRRLATRMGQLEARLLRHGRTAVAKRFDPQVAQNLSNVISGALNSGRPFFDNLLLAESRLVNAAKKAQAQWSKALTSSSKNPQGAVKALQKFGGAITEAFNKDLRDAVLGSALRPLGTLLLLEGALALRNSPNSKPQAPSALASLAVVKPGVMFDAQSFLDGTVPPAGELVIQQRLANLKG